MPSFITHHVFGHEVLKSLENGAVQKTIRANINTFNWGLQGPDLLFFRKALSGKSPLHAYGNTMHSDRDVGSLLNDMKKYIDGISDKKEREILTSYFYGFICHYCLDCEAHPYVYALQEKYTDLLGFLIPKYAHARIESDIDSAVYPVFSGGKSATAFDLRQYRYNKAQTSAVARLYKAILRDRYNIDVSKEEIEGAFKDAYIIERLLIDKGGVIYPIIKLVEKLLKKQHFYTSNIRTAKPFDVNILNMDKKIWKNPWHEDELNALSFLDLFDSAKRKALKMINGDGKYPSGLEPFDNGNPKAIQI